MQLETMKTEVQKLKSEKLELIRQNVVSFKLNGVYKYYFDKHWYKRKAARNFRRNILFSPILNEFSALSGKLKLVVVGTPGGGGGHSNIKGVSGSSKNSLN